jgi:hypothetical protein
VDGGLRRRARGHRRSGPPSARPSATTAAPPLQTGQATARWGHFNPPSRSAKCAAVTPSAYDPANQPVLRGPVESGQYTAVLFTKRCVKAGIEISMGSTGDCFDNACCETFHATLKKERIYRHSWPTRAAARSAIFEYIEGWYNPRRRHSTLGYRSPAEFEQLQAELARSALETAISDDGSVAAISPRAAEGLTTRRVATGGVDLLAKGPFSPENAPVARTESAQAATTVAKRRNRYTWPLRRVVKGDSSSFGGEFGVPDRWSLM